MLHGKHMPSCTNTSYMYSHREIHTHTESCRRQGKVSFVFLCHLSPDFLETRSPTEPEAFHSAVLVSQQALRICLTPSPMSGCRHAWAILGFSRECWRFELGSSCLHSKHSYPLCSLPSPGIVIILSCDIAYAHVNVCVRELCLLCATR